MHVHPEAEADKDTRIPLSAKGWPARARENPEGQARAEAFLGKERLVGPTESLRDSAVLTRVAERMEGLLEKALEAGHYELVDGSAGRRQSPLS